MSEDPKERISRIRAKISQLSQINPNTYLSDRQLDKITQKLEEKRKGIIVPILSLDHHKGIFEKDRTKHTFSLDKNAKDTGTIVANYFKKIELKKQQSANNKSINKQIENQRIDVIQQNLKKNQIIPIQNFIQNSGNDNQRKNEKQTLPIEKIHQNNKQISHSQKNSTSVNIQIHPISIFHQRQKKPEAIVIHSKNEDSLSKAEKINPFLSKQEPLMRQQEKKSQFIDIDQVSKVRTNIFKQGFNKNPPKNPFLISQQKKIEISFQKPKIKLGEQSIFIEDNQNNKIKRNEQIQPRFQPIKRMCSQPAPTSAVTAKPNNTDSIFAKSVSGINLQPARNQQISQHPKRSNERSENISIRQHKNIFNSKKVPVSKNNGSQKPLSSISESISELQSAQEDSALKIPRQKKTPVFEGGSNKHFQRINPIQQQKNHNHQVLFQNFGAKIPSQVKQVCQIEDNATKIPKQQYKQPQKINIFLSAISKDNDQASKLNPFKNSIKDKFDQKNDKNNTSSIAPITNIFSNLISKPANIFSQPNPGSKPSQELIFTKMATAGNIFGNSTIHNENTEENEEIEDDICEQSSQLIQAEDNADPNLSTVKYDYLKPDLIFKQPSVKFRCGNEQKESLENLLISLEKFPNSEDVYLIARMANKLISFNGKLLKAITKIRIVSGTARNVEISRILPIMPNKVKELVALKIQFKDLEVGERFMSQVEKIIN